MSLRMLLSGLVGCATGPTDPPVSAESDAGLRVVSLGAGLTEIAMALDPSRVVGVDTSSVWPAATDTLPKVGYNRTISAEGALSLGPTLVLASEDSGPPAALDQLRASGVTVEVLSDARTVEDVRARIQRIGVLFDRVAEAEAAVQAFDDDCAELAAAGFTDPPRAMFLYARSGGTLNVSGSGTAADAMFALAGLQNVVTGYEGYKPLTPEAAVLATPDWLILTTHGLEASGGVDPVRELPGLSLTPAGKSGQIATVDDLVMLGFGPRTCAGALALGREVRAR